MRTFSAKEGVWQKELDGIELAGFWPRAGAFLVDWILISLILTVLFALGGLAYLGVMRLLGHPLPVGLLHDHSGVHVHIAMGEHKVEDEPEWLHLLTNVLVPVLYFGTLLWKGKGRTPGKRLMRIRVVSIVHPHLTFWHRWSAH